MYSVTKSFMLYLSVSKLKSPKIKISFPDSVISASKLFKVSRKIENWFFSEREVCLLLGRYTEPTMIFLFLGKEISTNIVSTTLSIKTDKFGRTLKGSKFFTYMPSPPPCVKELRSLKQGFWYPYKLYNDSSPSCQVSCIQIISGLHFFIPSWVINKLNSENLAGRLCTYIKGHKRKFTIVTVQVTKIFFI